MGFLLSTVLISKVSYRYIRSPHFEEFCGRFCTFLNFSLIVPDLIVIFPHEWGESTFSETISRVNTFAGIDFWRFGAFILNQVWMLWDSVLRMLKFVRLFETVEVVLPLNSQLSLYCFQGKCCRRAIITISRWIGTWKSRWSIFRTFHWLLQR